jgi:hypothetical protein
LIERVVAKAELPRRQLASAILVHRRQPTAARLSLSILVDDVIPGYFSPNVSDDEQNHDLVECRFAFTLVTLVTFFEKKSANY